MRAGQLAIFKAARYTDNVGRPVTLIKEAAGNGYPGKGCWLVEGELEHPEENTGGMLPEEVPYVRAWVREEWLLPLNTDMLIRHLIQTGVNVKP